MHIDEAGYTPIVTVNGYIDSISIPCNAFHTQSDLPHLIGLKYSKNKFVNRSVSFITVEGMMCVPGTPKTVPSQTVLEIPTPATQASRFKGTVSKQAGFKWTVE